MRSSDLFGLAKVSFTTQVKLISSDKKLSNEKLFLRRILAKIILAS